MCIPWNSHHIQKGMVARAVCAHAKLGWKIPAGNTIRNDEQLAEWCC